MASSCAARCTAVCMSLILCCHVVLSKLQPWALDRNYYKNTCDNLEDIVFKLIEAKFKRDKLVAARLLRLHFHDAFVNGCDASVLLDTDLGDTERYSGANMGLGGIDLIDAIKAEVDKQCRTAALKPVVSCADILTLAARDAVRLVGGPQYTVQLGRRDGTMSTADAPATYLASPFDQVHRSAFGKSLLEAFRDVGLDEVDLVALSAAHSVGTASCLFSSDRCTQTTKCDNTVWWKGDNCEPISAAMKTALQQQCTQNPDERTTMMSNDGSAPSVVPNAATQQLSNKYFKHILKKQGVFTSDQSLANSLLTLPYVMLYANSDSAFRAQFARSMQRLGTITPWSLGPKAPYPPEVDYGVRVGNCSRPHALMVPPA